MEYRGIDISEYQPSVDFEQLKASGIDFVMIRTGFGRNPDQYDKCLSKHVSGAEKAGLPYGFYHYSYALTPAQAEAEAEFALELAKGYAPTMPFAYDIEDASQKTLTPTALSAIADTFLTKINNAGYYPMLYSSLAGLKSRFDGDLLKKYDVWLAQWASSPTYSGEYGMWQYTSSGRIGGVDGPVDMDIAYKDYPAIISEMEKPAPAFDNIPDEYARIAVEKALSKGILLGDDGNLMLHSPLTRQDFFVLMDRLGLLN